MFATIESVVHQKAHQKMATWVRASPTRGAAASLELHPSHICLPDSSLRLICSAINFPTETNMSIDRPIPLIHYIYGCILGLTLGGIRLVIPRDGVCGPEQSPILFMFLHLSDTLDTETLGLGLLFGYEKQAEAAIDIIDELRHVDGHIIAQHYLGSARCLFVTLIHNQHNK